MTPSSKIAVLGGGCFWCMEAVFTSLRGVRSVMPGYAGGTEDSPAYESVCGGKTDHAEVVRVEYDPEAIRYTDLLTVFFATHDPTTPNRQGNDVGSQYRSLILYTDETQRQEAEAIIARLNKSPPDGRAGAPDGNAVVTEVKPLEKFYEAEQYHRTYYAKNKSQPYCQLVINPKLEKLQKEFAVLLKTQGK